MFRLGPGTAEVNGAPPLAANEGRDFENDRALEQPCEEGENEESKLQNNDEESKPIEEIVRIWLLIIVQLKMSPELVRGIWGDCY